LIEIGASTWKELSQVCKPHREKVNPRRGLKGMGLVTKGENPKT